MSISPRTLRPSAFTPRSISGLALWLDASSDTLYTTDAGPVVAVTDPRDIGSLAVWLDASDSATLFQDASATTAASAASDPIGCWKDKSGNDRHYTGSSTTRPLLAVAKHNGRNSIYFDGTDDLLGVSGGSTTNSNSTLADATGACAWVVYEPNSDIDYAVLKFANSASGYERFTNGATYHTFFRTSRFGALSPAPPTSGLTLLASSASVATDSQALRINGSTIVSQPCATTFAAWRALTSQAWTVGQDAAYLNGWVSEVIVLGRSATAVEVAQVEKYLAAKWSISGVHAPATASSDPVGYWGDKSGNGRHVTTSDASTRPVIHSATHNGRKVLDFDGTNDTLSRDNYTAENDLTGLTRFGVFYSDSGAGPFHLSSVYSGGSYSSFASASSLLATHAGLSNSSQHANVSSVLTTGTTPRVFCARYDGTAGSFAAGLNIIMDGVTLPVASTTGTFPSSLPGGSPSLFIGSNIRANNWLNGKLCEYISYARALTTAERQRVERYLATRWGITLAPQVANADAQDWINRVYANGGSVSSATAGAVNSLCDSLDAASLRDRFYRLNLFCGSNLNAALVPLYRGPSLGGTQYGNATDTNNAFVGIGTDYAETGASGGLLGNGTTKYLNTGFNVDQLPGAADCHLSSFITGTQDIASARTLVGVLFNGVTDRYRMFLQLSGSTAPNYGIQTELGKANSAAATNRTNTNGGLILASRTSTTLLTLYDDAVSIGTTETSTTETTGASPFFVFARNGPTEFYNGRMAAYSIGAGMTAAQVTAYNTAIQSFQATMGRT